MDSINILSNEVEKTVSKKNLVVTSILQSKNGRFWTAHVKANTTDETGKVLSELSIDIPATQYDSFMSSYSAQGGAYILSLIFAKLEIVKPVTNVMKDYFKNSIGN